MKRLKASDAGILEFPALCKGLKPQGAGLNIHTDFVTSEGFHRHGLSERPAPDH